MSNISRNPFDNANFQAVEKAIDIAAHAVCQQINPVNFDPWATGNFFAESSHYLCGQFFNAEIEKIDYKIFQNQQPPDFVSFAGTRGWLYGYSCAQDKAKPVIEGLEGKLKVTQDNLDIKTEEANKLNAELEELKSRDPEKLAKRRLWGFLIVAAIAIAHIISEWQFDWPF